MKQGEAVADLNSGGKTRVQKQKTKVAKKNGVLSFWLIGKLGQQVILKVSNKLTGEIIEKILIEGDKLEVFVIPRGEHDEHV